MQLFRARKLLHSALTGYESGERDGAGREGVKDTSLKRNLIKISTGLDQHSAHKRIPLPSPLSIHRTAISPSYSQTRFLERSSNNWE